MKRLRILLSFFLGVFLFTSVQAGSIGLGISGNVGTISAEGTETEASSGAETENSVRSATAGNNFGFGTAFLEYNFGDSERFTIGVDYVPGTADVNNKSLSRTDVTADGNEANQQDGTRTANAEISDHITYYAELVLVEGFYVKAGIAQVDIKTKDSYTTGTYGTYPDKTLDATIFGLGVKGDLGDGGLFYKLEGTYHDYDTFSATSTTSNTVKANLDGYNGKLAIGMKF